MGFRFIVPGPPRGKGRPLRGKGRHVYTDAATNAYENLVCMAARIAAKPMKEPFKRRVQLEATFYMPQPKKMPKDREGPTTVPDLDNMLKAVLDGCNRAGVWTDDAIVCQIQANKIYGASPRVEVTISEF